MIFLDINCALIISRKSWDFTSILGLVDMSGMWGLKTHVNRPLALMSHATIIWS